MPRAARAALNYRDADRFEQCPFLNVASPLLARLFPAYRKHVKLHPVSYRRTARFYSTGRVLFELDFSQLPPIEPSPPPRLPPPPKPQKKIQCKASPLDVLTRSIMQLPSKPLHDGATGAYLFELQESVRLAYKPPPPHYRSFSRMEPTYSDSWLELPRGFRFYTGKKKK